MVLNLEFNSQLYEEKVLCLKEVFNCVTIVIQVSPIAHGSVCSRPFLNHDRPTDRPTDEH